MNTHIIVNEPCKNIRALARQTLRGHWIQAVLLMLLTTGITSLPSLIAGRLTDSIAVAILLDIFTVIVNGCLDLGLAVYFLKIFRQQEAGINDLATGFDHMGNAVLLYVIMSLRIMLWSLLFIIPGIITAIKYSQAFYILADDPGKSPYQCLYESAVMMEGNKDKYFRLNLSFIGWYLLANMPQMAISAYVMPDFTFYSAEELYNMAASIANDPLVVISGLVTVLVSVYVSASHACFYDLVNGNLYVQGGSEVYQQ